MRYAVPRKYLHSHWFRRFRHRPKREQIPRARVRADRFRERQGVSNEPVKPRRAVQLVQIKPPSAPPGDIARAFHQHAIDHRFQNEDQKQNDDDAFAMVHRRRRDGPKSTRFETRSAKNADIKEDIIVEEKNSSSLNLLGLSFHSSKRSSSSSSSSSSSFFLWASFYLLFFKGVKV